MLLPPELSQSSKHHSYAGILMEEGYEVAPIIHDCLLCVRYDVVVNQGDSARRSSSLEQWASDWQRHTPVPEL